MLRCQLRLLIDPHVTLVYTFGGVRAGLKTCRARRSENYNVWLCAVWCTYDRPPDCTVLAFALFTLFMMEAGVNHMQGATS